MRTTLRRLRYRWRPRPALWMPDPAPNALRMTRLGATFPADQDRVIRRPGSVQPLHRSTTEGSARQPATHRKR